MSHIQAPNALCDAHTRPKSPVTVPIEIAMEAMTTAVTEAASAAQHAALTVKLSQSSQGP